MDLVHDGSQEQLPAGRGHDGMESEHGFTLSKPFLVDTSGQLGSRLSENTMATLATASAIHRWRSDERIDPEHPLLPVANQRISTGVTMATALPVLLAKGTPRLLLGSGRHSYTPYTAPSPEAQVKHTISPLQDLLEHEGKAWSTYDDSGGEKEHVEGEDLGKKDERSLKREAEQEKVKHKISRRPVPVQTTAPVLPDISISPSITFSPDSLFRHFDDNQRTRHEDFFNGGNSLTVYTDRGLAVRRKGQKLLNLESTRQVAGSDDGSEFPTPTTEQIQEQPRFMDLSLLHACDGDSSNSSCYEGFLTTPIVESFLEVSPLLDIGPEFSDVENSMPKWPESGEITLLSESRGNASAIVLSPAIAEGQADSTKHSDQTSQRAKLDIPITEAKDSTAYSEVKKTRQLSTVELHDWLDKETKTLEGLNLRRSHSSSTVASHSRSSSTGSTKSDTEKNDESRETAHTSFESHQSPSMTSRSRSPSRGCKRNYKVKQGEGGTANSVVHSTSFIPYRSPIVKTTSIPELRSKSAASQRPQLTQFRSAFWTRAVSKGHTITTSGDSGPPSTATSKSMTFNDRLAATGAALELIRIPKILQPGRALNRRQSSGARHTSSGTGLRFKLSKKEIRRRSSEGWIDTSTIGSASIQQIDEESEQTQAHKKDISTRTTTTAPPPVPFKEEIYTQTARRNPNSQLLPDTLPTSAEDAEMMPETQSQTPLAFSLTPYSCKPLAVVSHASSKVTGNEPRIQQSASPVSPLSPTPAIVPAHLTPHTLVEPIISPGFGAQPQRILNSSSRSSPLLHAPGSLSSMSDTTEKMEVVELEGAPVFSKHSPLKIDLGTLRKKAQAKGIVEADPVEKVLVVCCECSHFYDPSVEAYQRLMKFAHVSGYREWESERTEVECPCCAHVMSTECCDGYVAVVYLRERLHGKGIT
jgi:hypothetical protein